MGPGPCGRAYGLNFWSPLSEQMLFTHDACSQKQLPEFIRGFRGFPGFLENGPNRAGSALGSTRAGGKDDSSLHKLPQTISKMKGTALQLFACTLKKVGQESRNLSAKRDP